VAKLGGYFVSLGVLVLIGLGGNWLEITLCLGRHLMLRIHSKQHLVGTRTATFRFLLPLVFQEVFDGLNRISAKCHVHPCNA